MSLKSKNERDKIRQKKLEKKRKKRELKKQSTPHTPHNLPQFADPIVRDYPEGALKHFGPLIGAEIRIPDALAKALSEQGQPIPPPVKGYMLIDTGASITSVAEHVFQELNLKPTNIRETIGVHGKKERYLLLSSNN